jgi:hypothetical protein
MTSVAVNSAGLCVAVGYDFSSLPLFAIGTYGSGVPCFLEGT